MAYVVALTQDGLMYRLAKAHALAAQEGALGRPRQLAEEEYPGLGFKASSARPGAAPPEEERHGGDCRCDCCADEWEFRKNMSPNGPQALYDCEMSTFDWLRFLGIDTEANVASVRRACRLSTCYFDIEAYTTGVDPSMGN